MSRTDIVLNRKEGATASINCGAAREAEPPTKDGTQLSAKLNLNTIEGGGEPLKASNRLTALPKST
jgi:hypothetical protein